MASDARAPIESVIDGFERRARRRQLEAYGFLTLMLVGIAAAAYVFIKAKEITDRDTKTDISTKISSLKTSISENRRDIIEAGGALSDGIFKIFQELPNMLIENCESNSRQMNFWLSDWVKTLYINDQLIPKNDFIKYLTQPNLPPVKCLILSVRAEDENQRPHSIALDFVKLKEIQTNKWDYDPSALKQNFDRMEHKRSLSNKAMQILQDDLDRQEVAPLVGRSQDQQPPLTLSLPFLLQLNITRFGTITLVVIALGILAPLYRFSARLATFYRGRADMLRVHQIPGYKHTGIVRLSPIFTPTFDFGKTQAMPDHLSELVRAALEHGKDKE